MAEPVKQGDLVFPVNPNILPYFEPRYDTAPEADIQIPGAPATGWMCCSDASLELAAVLYYTDGAAVIGEGTNAVSDLGSDSLPWTVAVSVDCKGLEPTDYYIVELTVKPIDGDPFIHRLNRVQPASWAERGLDVYSDGLVYQTSFVGGSIGKYELGVSAFNLQSERTMTCAFIVDSSIGKAEAITPDEPEDEPTEPETPDPGDEDGDETE